MTSIRQQAPPAITGFPKASFEKDRYEDLIFTQGYDVIVYDAVECPCKSQGSTNLIGCQNCLGLGWVFINPIETKAIITSINKDTKYKFWSPEFKGTVNVTMRDVNKLSFMDKIVLKNRYSVMSEVRPIKSVTINNVTQKFIFTSYPITNVNHVFIFQDATHKLIRLTPDKYSVSPDNPYVLKLDSSITYPTNFNGVVSIDYDHKIQYNVVDIPHDVRTTTYVNDNGQNKMQEMPVSAVCQKSQYLTGDSPLYDGTGFQDNSYL